MNLSPTDKDKLQAYLDAVRAVPVPDIRSPRESKITRDIVYIVYRALDWAERILQ